MEADATPPMAFRLRGPLNQCQLVQAITALVRRQAALRTTFASLGGEAVQVVSPDAVSDFECVDVTHLKPEEAELEVGRMIRVEACRPFALDRAPLMRVRLVRLQRDEHILVFVLHHIISDLWSMKVLWRELGALYRSGGDEVASGLPPLPKQYIDFADWQRKWFTGGVLSKHVNYLQAWARTGPQVDLLPSSPQDDTRRGAVASVAIDPGTANRIRRVSREQRVTVFMFLLGVFNAVLKRYTERDHQLVAAMIANRPSTELERLLGVFATSVALRTDVSGSVSVAELMARTRDVCLDAYANQYLPLWQLAELTGQDLDSRTLRPRISFTLQTAPVAPSNLPELEVAPFACRGAAIFEGEIGALAPFDQSWEVWETGAGYDIAVVYRKCVSSETINEMLVGFVDVLKWTLGACATGDAAVAVS